MNFALITALLLCSLSWISVSASESHTVEVQAGEDVTLTCTNMSKYESVSFWFRLVNRTNIGCVSVLFRSNSKVEFCDGYQNGRFEMKSNISDISLTIKSVDSSDAGLYFCGFYFDGRPIFSGIYLNIEDGSSGMDSRCKKDSNGIAKLVSWILGVATVFLVMVIIGLVVKNRRLQKAHEEGQNPEQSENVASADLNYAAITFRPKGRRELDPNIIYANPR